MMFMVRSRNVLCIEAIAETQIPLLKGMNLGGKWDFYLPHPGFVLCWGLNKRLPDNHLKTILKKTAIIVRSVRIISIIISKRLCLDSYTQVYDRKILYLLIMGSLHCQALFIFSFIHPPNSHEYHHSAFH